MPSAPYGPSTQSPQRSESGEPRHLAQPFQPQSSSQMNAVTEPRPRPSIGAIYRISQALYLLAGIVEALIITRVALKLLAANTAVGFVRFVYGISAPLVAPFSGIFPTPVSNANVLELSSLLAMAVYGLIAWGIVSFIFILGRRPLPATAG
jgi:YggT family protein